VTECAAVVSIVDDHVDSVAFYVVNMPINNVTKCMSYCSVTEGTAVVCIGDDHVDYVRQCLFAGRLLQIGVVKRLKVAHVLQTVQGQHWELVLADIPSNTPEWSSM